MNTNNDYMSACCRSFINTPIPEIALSISFKNSPIYKCLNTPIFGLRCFYISYKQSVVWGPGHFGPLRAAHLAKRDIVLKV